MEQKRRGEKEKKKRKYRKFLIINLNHVDSTLALMILFMLLVDFEKICST